MQHTVKEFLEKVLSNELGTLEFYKYIKFITDEDIYQLRILEQEIISFKIRITFNKLIEIQNSELYKRMEGNGEEIPMISKWTYIHNTAPEKELLKEKIIREGIQDFTSMFLPNYFENVDTMFRMLLSLIKRKEGEMLDEDREVEDAINIEDSKSSSGILWNSSEIELTEFIKALIEAKKVSGKSEKEIFEKFCDFLSVPYFDKKIKLQKIKKRTKESTPLLNELASALENWANK